jgi:hypothetical protein
LAAETVQLKVDPGMLLEREIDVLLSVLIIGVAVGMSLIAAVTITLALSQEVFTRS